jgi:hypothetical protein
VKKSLSQSRLSVWRASVLVVIEAGVGVCSYAGCVPQDLSGLRE